MLCFCGIAASSCLGGSNAGGSLYLFTDDQVTYTSDHGGYDGASGVECEPDGSAGCPPYEGSWCEPRRSQAQSGYLSYRTEATIVVWVMAILPECARLKGAQFGLDYDPTKIEIIDHGTDADFEFTTASGGHDWPAPSAGTSLNWSVTQTAPVKELYWFAVAVGSEPASLRLIEHPTGHTPPSFNDDALPSRLDPAVCVNGLGLAGGSAATCDQVGGDRIGCCLLDGSCQVLLWSECTSANGLSNGEPACMPNFCLTVATGACCLPNEGGCVRVPGSDCRANGGSYYGDWIDCGPGFCSTPIAPTSWGRIKSRYLP